MTAQMSRLDRLMWESCARAFEPQVEVDVFGLLEYEPTPKQQIFHDATEFDVLFGGAAGGGKTKSLVADDLRDAIRYPGIRIGAFRRTYGELKESLLAELAAFGFAGALGARWNGTEYELRFPNGSLIMYRYAESVADATRRQGGQYQKLTFDERNLTSPDVIRFLESRLRSGRKDLPVIGVRSGTNPGGVGHGASRDKYIDPTEYGKKVVTDVRGRTVRFISSKLADNPHVNSEYAMDLMGLPTEMRAAFLDGNWDAFAGAMFKELSRERHVLDPIELPHSWRRYNGVDWGFTKPWAVLWAAVDEDGRVWIYREIYECRVGEADQAQRILAAEGDEQIRARFADDAMWATRGDAKPIAEVYADNGVNLTKAGKGAGSRVQGWQRWRSYLAEGPACAHHRALGWETCPKVHLFSTCPDTYKELRDLPHAVTGDPEDADTRAPDHAADAGRYLLMNLDGAQNSDLYPPIRWRYWRPAVTGIAGQVDCGGRVATRSEGWTYLSVHLPEPDDSSDRFVGAVWCQTIGGDLLLLDLVRSRLAEADPAETLAPLVRRHNADTVFVGRKQLTETLRAQGGRAGVGFTPIDAPAADLYARAMNASLKVQAGRVWLPADAPWLTDWRVECFAFPHSWTHGYVAVLALAAQVETTRWQPPPRTPAAATRGYDEGPDFLAMAL
jgi:phage terminase large subunit-like protein